MRCSIQSFDFNINAMKQNPTSNPMEVQMLEQQLHNTICQFQQLQQVQYQRIMASSTFNFNPPRTVELLSYFEMNRTPKTTSGNNNMYCNVKCLRETVTETRDNFMLFPNVICLFLNYGKGVPFECKVNFEEKLDLEGYATNKKYSPKKYNLIGVIAHRGPSGDIGNCIAYCRHFDGQWYCFNGAVVTKCAFKDCKAEGEIPYVLFYVKEELDK